VPPVGVTAPLAVDCDVTVHEASLPFVVQTPCIEFVSPVPLPRLHPAHPVEISHDDPEQLEPV
jgi:hypothetical protein